MYYTSKEEGEEREEEEGEEAADQEAGCGCWKQLVV